MTGLNNVKLNNVRVITVRRRASILSLGSGGGIPVLVGQKRGVPKWQNLYSTIRWPGKKVTCSPELFSEARTFSKISQIFLVLWVQLFLRISINICIK